MRISDWSSDVCSSDLVRPEARDQAVGDDSLRAHLREQLRRGPGRILIGTVRRDGVGWRVQHQRCPGTCPAQDGKGVGLASIQRLLLRLELGRASCRERVCKYVSISVDAVHLKTTRDNDNTHQHTINYS